MRHILTHVFAPKGEPKVSKWIEGSVLPWETIGTPDFIMKLYFSPNPGAGRDHSSFNWFAEIATSLSQFARLGAGEG